MLWIPPKKTLKQITRLERKRRRRRVARFFFFVALIFVLTAASVAPAHHLQVQLDEVTRSHQFDFIDWLSQAIAGEIGRRLVGPPLPSHPAAQRKLVDRYLALESQRGQLEHQINHIYATTPSFEQAHRAASDLEQELAHLGRQQRQLLPQVETIISRQIEAVLRAEGFTIGGHVFPPVAFRLVEPPTMLIISPRDKIERQEFVGLQPGLDTALRTKVEDTLHRRGDVSSYITNIGGLGSYPTMVVSHGWLPSLIDITAHEWVHNYLYTFPTNIAWGYQTYPRLTTINETTASLVGEEISRKVIARFYPDWLEKLPPLDDNGQPAAPEPSEFHLAMRRIRQTVDQLLAENKIEEAEAYMEAERLKLVEKGHNLRRLNQAYFAFHGSYALSPGSVDPIGPQIRQLRAASPSLKAFLNRAGWLNSADDYRAWLQEAGIEYAEDGS